MGAWERLRLRERLSEEVVYEVDGERRRRRRADDALAVETAGERWCLSRVRRLRWRRRRLLRLLPRWVRAVAVEGADVAGRGCAGDCFVGPGVGAEDASVGGGGSGGSGGAVAVGGVA